MAEGKGKDPKFTHSHEELMKLAEEALNEEREEDKKEADEKK